MAKKEKSVIGLRYIGGGAYLPHVPARNLSADEMQRLEEPYLREARESGALASLYEPIYENEEPTVEAMVSQSTSEVSNG